MVLIPIKLGGSLYFFLNLIFSTKGLIIISIIVRSSFESPINQTNIKNAEELIVRMKMNLTIPIGNIINGTIDKPNIKVKVIRQGKTTFFK